jgi:hypothetical protein
MSLWYLSCCGVLNEGGGTRTHDLGIKSPLLYQLSYAPGALNIFWVHPLHKTASHYLCFARPWTHGAIESW